jgi:hypothetical protein
MFVRWEKRLRIAVLVVGVVLLGVPGWPGRSVAYEETTVRNGGTLTGRVVLDGPVPEPRVFSLVLYPFGPFCKRISDGQGHVLLQEFLTGKDGGLQDAVVTVQNVSQGKPFPPIKNEFVAIDCMFHPADVPQAEQYIVSEKGRLTHAHPVVAILQNHHPISVVNKDPIIHNGQVFQSERGNIVLNFPLPVSPEPRGGPIHFEPGKRIAQMICGMHEFMQSWGFMVDNPYYARTKRDGHFTIDALPPGTYTVSAWHPHLKPIEWTVTIRPGETTAIDFTFDAKKVVRPSYESQEKFRIGPEALPHQHLEGGECEPPYCTPK